MGVSEQSGRGVSVSVPHGVGLGESVAEAETSRKRLLGVGSGEYHSGLELPDVVGVADGDGVLEASGGAKGSAEPLALALAVAEPVAEGEADGDTAKTGVGVGPCAGFALGFVHMALRGPRSTAAGRVAARLAPPGSSISHTYRCRSEQFRIATLTFPPSWRTFPTWQVYGSVSAGTEYTLRSEGATASQAVPGPMNPASTWNSHTEFASARVDRRPGYTDAQLA